MGKLHPMRVVVPRTCTAPGCFRRQEHGERCIDHVLILGDIATDSDGGYIVPWAAIRRLREAAKNLPYPATYARIEASHNGGASVAKNKVDAIAYFLPHQIGFYSVRSYRFYGIRPRQAFRKMTHGLRYPEAKREMLADVDAIEKPRQYSKHEFIFAVNPCRRTRWLIDLWFRFRDVATIKDVAGLWWLRWFDKEYALGKLLDDHRYHSSP